MRFSLIKNKITRRAIPYSLGKIRIISNKLSYNFKLNSSSHNSQLKWWLIYGLGRTGTSYLVRSIRSASKLYVSDWGLGYTLNNFHLVKGIDKARFYQNLSSNILDNAGLGEGNQLDLIFKQANMSFEEFEVLVKMWGEPERKIFTFREPTSWIASAEKKFSDANLSHLQSNYINNLQKYEEIGGDIFEYSQHLTKEDYLAFLQPLQLNENILEDFVYKGVANLENTTQEMLDSYKNFQEVNGSKVYNRNRLLI